MILYQKGGPIEFPGAKYANPYLVAENEIPTVGRTILPDPQRQGLIGTNANEYKMGVEYDGTEYEIPTIVGGQYLGAEGARDLFKSTGNHFKPMTDPNSYSRFYDMISRLGIMR